MDVTKLDKQAVYRFLTSAVTPRPIAFVTSVAGNGSINAAPFSYFNVVSAEPPLLSISVGRREGRSKDTARNIIENEEFVVHLPEAFMIEAVNQTAMNASPDESELQYVSLETIESTAVKVPAIKEARVRLECRLERHLVFEEGSSAADMIIGRIIHAHVEDGMLEGGVLDPEDWRPVARLGGKKYAELGRIFELERPQ